jgi:pyruvate dehydrogenase E1 component alpha subunit
MKATRDQRLWMYEAMYRSRRLDDAVLAAYMEGKTPVFHMGKGPLPGEMHQSFGQEPCAVGVCAHLGKDDAVGAGAAATCISMTRT